MAKLPEFIAEPYPINYMFNRGGVWWREAKKPARLHRCRAWTIGHYGWGTMYRCACGAWRWGHVAFWHNKNSRTKETS